MPASPGKPQGLKTKGLVIVRFRLDRVGKSHVEWLIA
jgi:hypothetical protein